MSSQAHMTVNYKEWNVGPVHTDEEKGRKWEKVWIKLLLEYKETFWYLKWTKMKIKGFVRLIYPRHVIPNLFLLRNTKGDVQHNVTAALFRQHTVSRDAYGRKSVIKIVPCDLSSEIMWFVCGKKTKLALKSNIIWSVLHT